MNSIKQAAQLARWPWCLAALLVAMVLSVHPARSQFLQPQSHLGRLVQSITSPLVLSSSSSGGSESDSYDPEGGPSGGSESSSPAMDQAAQQLQQHQQHQQQHQRPQQNYQQTSGAYGREPQYMPQHKYASSDEGSGGYPGRAGPSQPAGLQQAPSQQRGVPQQYYGSEGPHDDEDSGAPTNHHKQQAGGEQYQMGAYLGPTMDDKEIQGAFNSNDDKDDDEASSYEGPPSSGGGGGSGTRNRGAASSYAASQPDPAGYSPNGYDGRGPIIGGFSSADDGPARGQRGASEQANFDDELGADEDDEPARPRGGRKLRFKSSSSLNQAAASQYNVHRPQQQQHSGMMAAANGYSPMGAGPFDLSGLMAAAGGAANGQAFEVYNGDGSYPGQGYYQQQGNGQRGNSRNQAASMNSPYGYNGGNPYGPMGAQQNNGNGNGGRNADGEDNDNDQDED